MLPIDMTPNQISVLQELDREIADLPAEINSAAAKWQIRSGPDRQALSTRSGAWSGVQALTDEIETTLYDGARVIRIALLDGSGVQIWSRQRTVGADMSDDTAVYAGAPVTPARSDLASASIEISAQRVVARAYDTEARRFESMHQQYIELLALYYQTKTELEIAKIGARSETAELIAGVAPTIVDALMNRGFSKPAFEKFLSDHPEIAPTVARLVWDSPSTKECIITLLIQENENGDKETE